MSVAGWNSMMHWFRDSHWQWFRFGFFVKSGFALPAHVAHRAELHKHTTVAAYHFP
jgi:hypothetical protein